METINQVFTEQQVESVSEKILKLTIEKTKSQLSDVFYNEMKSFLYEHYLNVEPAIYDKLIKDLCDEFIESPMNGKFLKLRRKLFNDNKELLKSLLTDEAIKNSVENVIWSHTQVDYHFSWKWYEAITAIIISNIDKFEQKESVLGGLSREISKLKSQNESLKRRINEISDITELP